jgi:hypothetical protein
MLESILASFKNQVDMNRDNQVDIFTEANEKSASIEADSSILALIFGSK